MRIAIYTDIIPKDKKAWHGKDWFIYETIHHIASAHPEHTFIIISRELFHESPFQLENIEHLSLESYRATKLSLYRLLNWKLPALLKRERAEALLSLNGFLPLKSKIPSCLVVEDLSFIEKDIYKTGNIQGYLKNHFGPYLAKADAIATVSDYCRKRLVTLFMVPPEKIAIIHKGIYEGFRPLSWQQKEEIKNEYTDGREYFIYTGSICKEKNLINLLKGFSVLKKRLRSNMVLILAGREDPGYREFPELMHSYHFRDDVKRIGRVDISEMTKLIGASYALVSPSATESYSSSVMEALRCNVPVLAASGSMYEELAGEAALYFNPAMPEDIGDRFCEIYKDENLRAKLIAQTDKQVNPFSWSKTSEVLWNCLYQVMK